MEPRTSKRLKKSSIFGFMKKLQTSSWTNESLSWRRKSRNEVWCKRPKLYDGAKKDDKANNTIVWYGQDIQRQIKKFNVEANFTQNEQLENVLTNDMSYGQRNESVARTLCIEKMKKNVRPAGLFIDKEFSFLDASPDDM